MLLLRVVLILIVVYVVQARGILYGKGNQGELRSH
jgi:hypothetical protein